MGDLVPCKFFLRGSCRYGDSCRFYHGAVGSGVSVGNFSHPFQPQSYQLASHPHQPPSGGFSSVKFPYSAPAPSFHEDEIGPIIATIREDMQEWERTIWPFSTYGPLSLRPSLPGTEDLSDEELRYAVLQNGNTIPSELNLEERCKALHNFRRTYSETSVESISMIKSLLELPYDPMNTSPPFLVTYRPPPQQQKLPSALPFFSNSTMTVDSTDASDIFGRAQSQPTSLAGASSSSFSFVTATRELNTKMTPSMPSSSFTFTSTVPPPVPPTPLQQFHSTQPSQPSAFSTFSFSRPQSSSFLSQSQTEQPTLKLTTSPGIDSIGTYNQSSPTSASLGTSGNFQIPDELMYSRDEDLSPTDIAMFEATQFEKVPLVPPSRKFCL